MLLNIVVFALFGFLAMYFIYKPVLNKYNQTLEFKPSMLVFPYIFGLYATCAVVAYFAVDTEDFVEPISLLRIFTPLIFAALIYASTLMFSLKVIYAITAIAVGITVWLQPLGVGNVFPYAPVWVRLGVFVWALIFCFCTRIMNILPHTFILPHIIILGGLIMLALIGASPFYIAVCAAILIGISAAYLSMNYFNVVIDLDDGACVAMSYLVCSLLLMNLGEFCFPSCVILTTVFWAELVVALYNRFVVTHLGNLSENSNYFFAAQRHTLQTLSSAILKIGIVLLLLSWFQLFSVNPYSLPLIALLIVLWLDGALGRRENTPHTLAEINRKFVADLKQNVQEMKDFFNPDKKDKE